MRTLASRIAADLRREAATEPFGLRGALAYTLDTLARKKKRSARPEGMASDHQAQMLASQLRTRGFASIENFISPEAAGELRSKLESAIKANPRQIHPSTPYDLRLHGVENVEPAFKWFGDHPLLKQIAERYLNTPTSTAFVLGASLQSVPGNPGSGGGWHRDSFGKQFKSMLYLTDVGPENGPFQYVDGSHTFLRTINDNVKMSQPYGKARLEHEQVMDLLARTGQGRLLTLGGKAGTLLMFDSSGIHRGSPIKEGIRMALTNYYYPNIDIGESLYAHFKPVAGHSA